MISEKNERDFRIADSLYEISSIFELRRKYSKIYTLQPKELLIHYNESTWNVWEEVLS